MITRYRLACGGCVGEFVARIELSPSRMTRFAFPCPLCGYIVRGRYEGLKLDDLRVMWDDVTVLPDEVRELDIVGPVATVGTTIPLRPSARRLEEFGGGPNMTFGYLIGSNRWANRYHERLHSQAQLWMKYDRLLHYYLSEDWSRFDATGRSLVGPAWKKPGNVQERHIAALWPAQILLIPNLPGTYGRQLIKDWSDAIQALDGEVCISDWAVSLEDSGELGNTQRQLFGVLQAFVRGWESWSTGILIHATEPARLEALDELRLARDEFGILRDLYIQIYETCFKAMPLAMAVLNAQFRDNPNSFGEVPASILRHDAKAKAPTSLKAFSTLPNAKKIPWFAEWHNWSAVLPNVLSKGVRNSLGHANATHDVATGRITGEKFEMSYLDLTASAMVLGHALLTMLQVTKTMRLLAADSKANSSY